MRRKQALRAETPLLGTVWRPDGQDEIRVFALGAGEVLGAGQSEQVIDRFVRQVVHPDALQPRVAAARRTVPIACPTSCWQ